MGIVGGLIGSLSDMAMASSSRLEVLWGKVGPLVLFRLYGAGQIPLLVPRRMAVVWEDGWSLVGIS